jgi:hypothetical protein
MTTRQHLIEQDCMDRLHWTVDRVAAASDEEMIQALTMLDKQPTEPAPPRPQSPVVCLKKTPSTHIVDRLRESIRMKMYCLTSDDLLQEDSDLLGTSIESDKQTLQNELNSLRDQIDVKRIEENKKMKIITLLQTVVQSVSGVDDVLHLKEATSQLAVIKSCIKQLKQLIG